MDGVPCLRCGERGSVRVRVDDGDTITCSACDEEFTAADVRAVVDSWGPLLGWLDAHPARVEEAKVQG